MKRALTVVVVYCYFDTMYVPLDSVMASYQNFKNVLILLLLHSFCFLQPFCDGFEPFISALRVSA